MHHPSFSELIDFLDRKLNTTEQKQVREHLANCTDCQHTLEIARYAAESTGPDPLVAPPTDLVQRAVAAFRRKQSQLAERIRTAATLQFDNLGQVAALGARGIVGERQLLYSFDQFDLDLQIGTTNLPNGLILRGQLLPIATPEVEAAGTTVQLAGKDFGPWRRLTDPLGRFTFSDLFAGAYSLQISLEANDVVIEPLVLPG